MARTQVTCRRCNGSGHFSFHLTKGTVCFGCNGSGFQMIDEKKEAARKASSEKRAAAAESKRAAYLSATHAVVAELNALYGPFDTDTELGLDRLNKATADATGKSMWAIRDERMAARP